MSDTGTMFKVGDEVKCIDSHGVHTINAGHTYEVFRVHAGGALVSLVGKGNEHGVFHYDVARFVLHKRACPFKVGDVVYAKHNNPNKCLIKHDAYKIAAIHGDWLSVRCNEFPHHISSFEKESSMTPTVINEKAKPKSKGKQQANTYYVQRLGGNAPTVVHLTFDDAKNEANRLAALHPSAEFYVLAKVYSIKKVPVYTTESQEYSV